jgi:hypothetical protein
VTIVSGAAPPDISPHERGGGWAEVARFTSADAAVALIEALQDEGIETRTAIEPSGDADPAAEVVVSVRLPELETALFVMARVSFEGPDAGSRSSRWVRLALASAALIAFLAQWYLSSS